MMCACNINFLVYGTELFSLNHTDAVIFIMIIASL